MKKVKKSAKNLDMTELETISGGEVVGSQNNDGSGYYFSTKQQEKKGTAQIFYYKSKEEQGCAYKNAKEIDTQYAKKKW